MTSPHRAVQLCLLLLALAVPMSAQEEDEHALPYPAGPMLRVGDRAVFVQEPPSGPELWVSDGTAAGTFRLPVPCPEPCDFLRLLGGDGTRVFYQTFFDLGVTDGTAEGSFLLTDFTARGLLGFQGFELVPADGLWFFVAGDEAGVEPWRTDGTPAGTFRAADVHPGPGSSFPAHLSALGGRLLFSADDGTTGFEPWVSDGTPAGTLRLGDLVPGPESSGSQAYSSFGSEAVFFADTASGREPWVTDGTPEGTRPLPEIRPGSLGFQGSAQTAAAGGLGFFAASDSPPFDELWRTDGSDAGTFRVSRFAETAAEAGGEASFVPELWGALGGRLLFTARLLPTGREPWVSDGTVPGTRLLADVCPGGCGSASLVLGRAGERFLFLAESPAHGREMWATDGTPEGTSLLADLCPGPCSGDPRLVAATAEAVYVVADDGTSGDELYRLEITGGAHRLTDFAPAHPFTWKGPDPGFPDEFPAPILGPFRGAVLPTGLLFLAGDLPGEIGLFTTDGTAAGTRLVEALDLPPGPCVPAPRTLCLGEENRFRVEVDWHDVRSGDSGDGFALLATADSGFFWFFEPSNLELVVKVLDARVVNGHFWVFTAALTNVERTITVIDTDTGATRRYHRPAGDPRGQLDVTAF